MHSFEFVFIVGKYYSTFLKYFKKEWKIFIKKNAHDVK
jgi:hypothetical protein